MTQFDTVVLGAGPGGYGAAIRSAQLGMKTAIVEGRWWGGACQNVGCLPIRSLVHNAEVAQLLTRDQELYGIRGEASLDYGLAQARARTVSERMVKGVHLLLRKNKVTEYQGHGVFRDAGTLAVSFDTGVTETLTFDQAVIATGARPWLPEGVRAGGRVVTAQDFSADPVLPRSVIVCGAGSVGLQVAYVLVNYGVKVTLVEAASHLLPREDPEVAAEVTKAYRNLGVSILTDHTVTSVTQSETSAIVTLVPGDGGGRYSLKTEKVVLALGARPLTEGYGLEQTGVELADGGAIATDRCQRTSVAGLYAVGGVTGASVSAGAAQAQGIVAAETIGQVPTFPVKTLLKKKAWRKGCCASACLPYGMKCWASRWLKIHVINT